MSLNHILLGGTWERVTLRSRALVAIRRNCYVQQNFNSWWKTSDERTQTFLFPFLFIYLFIFLSFGFSFRSIDVLDCIESRRNIFGFWILLIIPVPLNPFLHPPPPPTPGWGYGKRISFRPFFLYSKLSVLNTLKWDLYVLLVRLKSVIYTPTLAKRPKRSSRSSAHRRWRPFS